MIDGVLLTEYMAAFYGYGSYGAKVWLVGMEEGGGTSIDEITARLASWVAGGKKELDDVREFHQRTGVYELYKWFEPSPRIQSTWGKIIKVLLYSQGVAVSSAAVRHFQGNNLGRSAGDWCILELLPLPSPGKKDWFYNKWTGLSQLMSRRTYETAWKTRRATHIRQRIQEHGPRLVLFYGGGDGKVWEGVINEELRATSIPNLHLAKIDQTVCAFTKLPQAIADWELQKVGTTLARHLPEN
jgi:hypothetical protein